MDSHLWWSCKSSVLDIDFRAFLVFFRLYVHWNVNSDPGSHKNVFEILKVFLDNCTWWTLALSVFYLTEPQILGGDRSSQLQNWTDITECFNPSGPSSGLSVGFKCSVKSFRALYSVCLYSLHAEECYILFSVFTRLGLGKKHLHIISS